MTVHRILLATAIVAAGIGGAQAQSVVSRAVGLAHDCFTYAKDARDLKGGIEVCSESLSRELLTHKDRAATYDNRGVLYDLRGMSDQAESDFRFAIGLEPNLGDAYVNLGSVMIRRAQYEDALDNINKGLALGMAYPHIGYFDRALAEEMLHRFKESYADYKKVLELQPGYPKAVERLKDFTVMDSGK